MSLTTPQPLQFTLLETIWLLRRLRLVRDQMHMDMIAIEERIRGGHDGELAQAHHVMGGEEQIVSGAIEKLWVSLGRLKNTSA